MLLHMATIISRDQLYDIVPTANNMVLYISKCFKKTDFFKCSYHEKRRKIKGHKGNLSGIEYIYY